MPTYYSSSGFNITINRPIPSFFEGSIQKDGQAYTQLETYDSTLYLNQTGQYTFTFINASASDPTNLEIRKYDTGTLIETVVFPLSDPLILIAGIEGSSRMPLTIQYPLRSFTVPNPDKTELGWKCTLIPQGCSGWEETINGIPDPKIVGNLSNCIGSAPIEQQYSFKILFEDDNRNYYVGGWNTTPVFVANNPNQFNNRLELFGITSTGSQTTDWIVSGFKRGTDPINGDYVAVVFYGPNGLIREDIWNYAFAYLGGKFASGCNFDNNGGFFRWTTESGIGNDTYFAIPGGYDPYGFIAQGAYSDTRLNLGGTVEALRKQASVDLDLAACVFIGNNSADPATFPQGNPWLWNADGFFRLDTDLNDLVPKSHLLNMGGTMTLFTHAENFIGAAPWPSAGQHGLTITPYAISSTGQVTQQEPLTLSYYAPDPGIYFARDASLWISSETSEGSYQGDRKQELMCNSTTPNQVFDFVVSQVTTGAVVYRRIECCCPTIIPQAVSVDFVCTCPDWGKATSYNQTLFSPSVRLRNWINSGAGAKADCKHIMAAKRIMGIDQPIYTDPPYSAPPGPPTPG